MRTQKEIDATVKAVKNALPRPGKGKPGKSLSMADLRAKLPNVDAKHIKDALDRLAAPQPDPIVASTGNGRAKVYFRVL